jgi:hypothetical protein
MLGFDLEFVLDTIKGCESGRRALTGEWSGDPTGLFLVLVDGFARNEFVLFVDDDDIGP